MIYKDKYCHYRATRYLCIESLPFLYYFSCMVYQIIEKHIGPVAATIKKSRASQVDKRIVIQGGLSIISCDCEVEAKQMRGEMRIDCEREICFN